MWISKPQQRCPGMASVCMVELTWSCRSNVVARPVGRKASATLHDRVPFFWPLRRRRLPLLDLVCKPSE